MLPGITGLWQVSGRSDLDFDDLVRLDFLYLERWSVFLDLSILVKTVPAVFGRTHPRHRTPHVAVIFSVAEGATVVVGGEVAVGGVGHAKVVGVNAGLERTIGPGGSLNSGVPQVEQKPRAVLSLSS